MVDSFLHYIQFEKRFSNHTITSYQNDLNKFLEFVSVTFGLSLENVTHNIIRSWVLHLSESGDSPKSINRRISTLRSFYKFLLKREIVQQDPTTRLQALKTSKPLPEFVPAQDILALLDKATFEDTFKDIRDKLILELLYGTGIRLSELIHLKEMDVNQFDRTLKVLGKRNKERIIPVPSEVMICINTYLAKKKIEGLSDIVPELLVNNNGQPLYPMFIYRTVKKHLEIFSAVDKKSPHVLRHSFATHLLDKGADLNAVKDLLGHSSLAATQVYTHNSLEKLRSSFEQAHPKA